jgi:hypothetical protein
MIRTGILLVGGVISLALAVQTNRPQYSVLSGNGRGTAISQGIVSVKQFGATGDGLTDDSEAIFNALTVAKKTGGRLFFPSGTYLLNTPQRGSPNGRSIEYFTGMNNIEMSGVGSASAISTTLKNTCTFEFVTPTHLLVHNLKFVGVNGPNPNSGSNTCGANIRLDGAVGSQIYENEFSGTSNAGVWLSGAEPGSPGSLYNVVRDNYFHDSAVSAIWEDDCNKSDNYSSCTSPFDSPPYGNRIIHNRALRIGSQLGGGVISLDSGLNSTDTEVSGNYIEGGSETGLGSQPNGIQVTNDSYVLIAHNVIINSGANCIALTPAIAASNVEIKDNTCTGAGSAKAKTGSMDGIVVFASTTHASESNLTITGNRVQGSQQYGIVIGGVSGVNSSNFHNILIACNHIVGNDLDSPGSSDGIRVVGQGITIANNLVDGSAGASHRYGINIDSSSSNITVSKNTITGFADNLLNNASESPVQYATFPACTIW